MRTLLEYIAHSHSQVLYDVAYDDGDAEEGVLPSSVRPLARLLTKASAELELGDEAVVNFRGSPQQRYLATVTARNGSGDSGGEVNPLLVPPG